MNQSIHNYFYFTLLYFFFFDFVPIGADQKHRDLAREAVRKSLVLLKNDKHDGKPLLPLPKKVDKKILVAGTHADNIGFQCGGWTINWQGFSGNKETSGEKSID